jgi:hypothetical protein
VNNVIVVDFHRLERRRVSGEPERLPLAITATPGAVLVVLADAGELSFSPKQFREFFAEGMRLADEAEALAPKGRA